MNQHPTSPSDAQTNGAPRYDPHPGLVALGTRVEVEIISELGDSERLTFDIVPDRRGRFHGGLSGGQYTAGAGNHGTAGWERRAVPGRRAWPRCTS